MKKHVVFSYNSQNPDYAYFAPLAAKLWGYFGWTPVIVIVGAATKYGNDIVNVIRKYDRSTFIMCHELEEYRSATIAQISRLYAARYIDGLIMTADVDMLPLSNYWHAQLQPTVYGYDLTGHKEFPICYVSMISEKWREVMKIDDSKSIEDFIKRDLDSMPNAKSEDFYKWWGVDQQLITERLKPYNPVQILRGQYPNGYARGRVDRGNWTLSLDSFIDCHMFHQVYHKGREQYFDKTMELLTSLFPEENWDWFVTYTNEFRKLTGHA